MAGMAGIAAVLLAANFIAAASLTVAAQRLCAQRIEPAAIGLAAFAAIAGLAFVFVGPVSPPIWVLAFVIAGACLMAVFRQARVTDRI
jgi:hypothetical protein